MLANNRESIRVSLEDLITIFDTEAKRVCFTEKEAEILASLALQDFLSNYARNVILQ